MLVGSDSVVCSGAMNGATWPVTCSASIGWSSDALGLLGMMPSSQVLLQVSENCRSYATMRARKERFSASYLSETSQAARDQCGPRAKAPEEPYSMSEIEVF